MASSMLLRRGMMHRSVHTSSVRGLSSFWADVPRGPEDAILGVTLAYQADPNPKKINLGVGAYRGDDGKPFVLKCVRSAEENILNERRNMEYLPVVGDKQFLVNAINLAFKSDNEFVQDGRCAAIQTLSGTGACRMAAEFFSRFHKAENGRPLVLMPNPTWANHPNIFKDGGCDVAKYRYYDSKTCDLDIEGCLEDMKKAPRGSVVLLHACAHNPTGVDPQLAQWKQISDVMQERGLIPFFDMAYQGFTSGDLDEDAAAVRMFVEQGHRVVLAQSFSKNFGLYGHRLGSLTFLAETHEEKAAIESQLKILARPCWSNPPIHGASIVNEIFKHEELYKMWTTEMRGMAERIITMRHALYGQLLTLGSERNWGHITKQRGMFCYSGLTPQEVERLRKEYSVYLTSNGRVSMAGVASKNVDYLAEAIHGVTK